MTTVSGFSAAMRPAAWAQAAAVAAILRSSPLPTSGSRIGGCGKMKAP